MATISEIKSNLETGANSTKETGDFLSYAQFIDQNLTPACNFSEEEAAELLGHLADVLDAPSNEHLCSQIGWDIPELLMLYVDEFSPGPTADPHPDILKNLSRLANVLCLKSNPKEFFLKVCELMRDVDIFANEDGDGKPVDDEEDSDFQANTRFCLLFEMMRFSLNRIVTPYPTRFIKTANAILLEVANSKKTITGVTTVLRRIFIFARDFDMDLSEASEEEKVATRKLLVSLLTYGADVSLQNFSVKWTERYYYQIANKLDKCSDAAVRSSSYNLSLYTARLDDALSRCAQLAISYDMDPISEVIDSILKNETTRVRSYSLRPTGDQNDTLDYLLTPSLLGTFFLYSQIHFLSPPCQPSMEYSIKKSLFCRKHCPMTCGIRDATLFWALKHTAYIEPESFNGISLDSIEQYIKCILCVAGESNNLGERRVAFCIVGKVLAQLEPNDAVGVMANVIRTSEYPNIRDAYVQILKSVLLGTKAPKSGCIVAKLAGLCVQPPRIRAELLHEVALIAEEAVDGLMSGEAKLSPYILSWINLLHVVDTDPEVVARFNAKLDEYLAKNNDCGNCKLVKEALANSKHPFAR